MSNALMRLDAAADNLSSFDGDGESMAGYTGTTDLSLSYGGKKTGSLVSDNLENAFKINIRNTHPSEALGLHLGKGYKSFERKATTFTPAAQNGANVIVGAPVTIWAEDFVEGLIRTGTFKALNGTGAIVGGNWQGLSASSGSSYSIEEFMRNFLENPTYAKGLDITTDNEAQIDQEFRIEPISPYGQQKEEFIRPGDITSQNDFRSKKLKMDLSKSPMHFNATTAVEYTVLPATSVTLTLYMGAALVASHLMERKVELAINNRALARARRR